VEQGCSILLWIVMQDSKGRRGGADLLGELEGTQLERGGEQQDTSGRCLLRARKVTAENKAAEGLLHRGGGSTLLGRKKSNRFAPRSSSSHALYLYLAHTISTK
jgi:hypothetical protein